MGALAVLDEWILRLAEAPLIPPHFALRCAKVQAMVSAAQGHILALNDEYVWRKLKEAAPIGELPSIGVRCIRCGATANLRDWARCATMGAMERSTAYQSMPVGLRFDPGKFLLACDGEDRGLYVMLRLEQMVNAYDRATDLAETEAPAR